MATQKIRALKGLDSRIKPIDKDPSRAGDVQNVHLSPQGDIVKRNGYAEEVAAQGDTIALMEANQLSELIGIKADGAYRFSGGAATKINYGSSAPTNYTDKVDWAEYSGVLYVTDTALNNGLWKYDGSNFYKAGMRKIVANQNATSPVDTRDITPSVSFGATRTYAFQYGTVDAKNNIVYGQFDTLDAAVGDVAVINQQLSEPFKKKYANNPSIDVGYSEGDATLSVEVQATNHNLLVGDSVAVMVRRPLNDGFFTTVPVAMEVLSITVDTPIAGTDTIVFDSSSITSDDSLEVRGGFFSIFLRYFVASSAGAVTGFTLARMEPLDQQTATRNITLVDSGAFAEFPTPLEDIFDVIKEFRLPPIAKYVTIFQNQMVLANNKAEVLFNTDDTQSIWWSTLEIGGGVESFADSNRETIGKTSEGPITGLFANEDRITVFKQRQGYDLSGTLQSRNFVIRSLLTNGVGCVSHESIQELQGGCLFLSSRGFYYTGKGQTPAELSDMIEPTINDSDLDLSSAKVINEIQNERILWWIDGTTTDKVFVYDYYYKEWFIYTGINASGGLAYFGDEIYHADGTDLFRENSAYADNGEPIEAFYRTSFIDFGEPTLRKKYLGVTITDLSYSEWTATLEPYYNWQLPADAVSSSTITFDTTFVDDDYRLPNRADKSFSIKISNAELNEPFNISNINIEFSSKEIRSKGAD